MMTEEEFYKYLGRCIKKARLGRGITLEEIALKTGLAGKRLLKIEEGSVKRIRICNIQEIACCLNMKIYELFEDI